MVATRDTLALKNTKLGLETLEQMDYDRARIRIVLNRANTKVGISRQDVLAILGRDVDVLVPSHRDITRSVNEGIPIALQAQSPARRAFSSVADLYRDGAPPVGQAHVVDPEPVVAPARSIDNSVKAPRRRLLRRAARAGG
jgi:pilus assembly protein CpaE